MKTLSHLFTFIVATTLVVGCQSSRVPGTTPLNDPQVDQDASSMPRPDTTPGGGPDVRPDPDQPSAADELSELEARIEAESIRAPARTPGPDDGTAPAELRVLSMRLESIRDADSTNDANLTAASETRAIEESLEDLEARQ